MRLLGSSQFLGGRRGEKSGRPAEEAVGDRCKGDAEERGKDWGFLLGALLTFDVALYAIPAVGASANVV
jgi:hypothetical protein